MYVAANTPPDACLAGYMGIGLRGTCVTLAYQKECLLFFAHLIDTPLLPNPPYRWVFPPYPRSNVDERLLTWKSVKDYRNIGPGVRGDG